MAEKMVKVNLDKQRMYRVHHEDKDAITVGPGEVEVPAWVAEEWAKPAPEAVQPVYVDPVATKLDAILTAIETLQADAAALVKASHAETGAKKAKA